MRGNPGETWELVLCFSWALRFSKELPIPIKLETRGVESLGTTESKGMRRKIKNERMWYGKEWTDRTETKKKRKRRY